MERQLLNDPPDKTQAKRKPLRELFCQGSDSPEFDPLDEKYEPLSLIIEQTIRVFRIATPRLTDSAVLLALDQLAMHPEGDYPAGLESLIQFSLRIALTEVPYSRQAVRAALRKIAKSVQRHTRLAGPMGYREFIEEYVPP